MAASFLSVARYIARFASYIDWRGFGKVGIDSRFELKRARLLCGDSTVVSVGAIREIALMQRYLDKIPSADSGICRVILYR